MPLMLLRHGCLALTCCLVLPGSAKAQDPIRVQSRVFDVEYAVNESALPLAFASLWFTPDRGVTWHKFADDEDRQPPITFHAPAEGLFGLYVIAGNTTGPSSLAPTSRTTPHVWVFVDETPPIVQLHALRSAVVLGRRVVQIRWTAVDAYLGPRPVEIMYRRGQDNEWERATPKPLANTGRYDWPLPADLEGAIAVRLTVQDRGGHRVTSELRTLEIAPGEMEPATAGVPDMDPSPVVSERPQREMMRAADFVAEPSSIRATERASRLYRQAMTHGERGEYLEGIARLREAIKLKPQWADAFAQMARMLYRLGDLDRAREAYEMALQQQPAMRGALRGLAMVYRQMNDYSSAARSLRTILRYDPGDVEVWMNLGDVAIYQGDDILARECYLRASQMDPTKPSVMAEARQRLELMSDVSRRYRPRSD